MKKQEAIGLLIASRSIAVRLAALGVNIELTDADKAALKGFNQVCNFDEGSWLEDNQVFWAAGLRRSDIANLRFITARLTGEKNYPQHLEAESLDG